MQIKNLGGLTAYWLLALFFQNQEDAGTPRTPTLQFCGPESIEPTNRKRTLKLFKKGNNMIGAIVEHVHYGLGVVLKSEINDKSASHFLFVRWNEAFHWEEETYQHCWIDTEDIKVVSKKVA
jgi:hypothetical protein